MGYGVHYRLDFCDAFGVKQRVDILKKDYTGLVIPFVGSGDPFRYTYKNENEDKFNQITTSEATVSIISNPNISLDTFYTDDERTWKLHYYAGEFVANNWDDTRAWDDYTAWEEYSPNKDGSELVWAGYLLPASASESFRDTYEFQIKAKDILGTLKTVPYTWNGLLIKKIASVKDILIECLSKTELDLNLIVAVNIFADGFFAESDEADPLEQTYIDTQRFIDANNKAYSVYDVIKAICTQFTANLRQVKGRWYIVDVTEFAGGPYRAREFSYVDGSKIGPIYLDVETEVFPNELVGANHTFTKDSAYKSVSVYYQYGYLSNKLENGDFNIVQAPPFQPFAGWNSVNGFAAGIGRKKQILEGQGEVDTDDYYLLFQNSDMSRGLQSSAVSVLTTNTIAVSFFVGARKGSTIPLRYWNVVVALRLDGPNEAPRYWDSRSRSWSLTDSPDNLRFGLETDEFAEGKTLSFNTAYPPFSGTVSFIIRAVFNRSNPAESVEAGIDDVSISVDENQYFKSAIGKVVQLTNIYNYSKSPEPVVLLFGDDVNRNRTSWLRGAFDGATSRWTTKELQEQDEEVSVSLQKLVARNILRQHYKPTRKFEGTLRGKFNAMNAFVLPLTDGKFFFISGTFSAKKSTADVVLMEIFPNNFNDFNESTFEDFGDFKDSEGSKVGSTVGINIPIPAGAQSSTYEIPLEASILESEQAMIPGRFMSPFGVGIWWDNIKSAVQTILGQWDFGSRPTFNNVGLATINETKILRNVFNRATGQNQDAKLVLDVIDGKNVVSWEDVEAEPTVTTLKAKFPYNVGVAFKDALLTDVKYGTEVKTDFDQITPENGCKFGKIRPNRATFNFNELNDNFNWAKANGLKVHLHYLLPGGDDKTIQWFLDMEALPNAAVEVEAEIRLHIKTVLQHVISAYPGMVVSIDIVNECLTGGGNVKDSMLKRLFGEQYIDIVIDECNKWAPALPKLLNDFSFEYTSSKIEGVIALRDRIASRGYVLDGIGSQMHSVLRVMTETPESLQNFRDRIQLIADSGMVLHISELDVKCRKGTDGVDLGPYPFMTSQLEADQANFFVQVYKAVWEIMPPNKLLAVTVWSLDDNSNFENIPTMTDYTSIWYLENGIYKKRLAHQALLDMQIN